MTRTRLSLFAALVSFVALPAAAQELAPLMDRIERLERDIRTLNVQISNGKAPLASGSSASAPAADLPKAAGARLAARMDSLENDLRASTGTQETVSHQLRQLSERLDKLVSDIDYRLGVIESKLGVGGAPASGAAPATAPVTDPQAAGVMAAPKTVGAGPGVQSQSLGTVSAKAVEAVQQGQAQAAAQAPSQVAVAKPVTPAPAPQAAPAAPAPAPGGLPAGTPKEQYTYAFNLLRQTNYDQAEIALKQFIDTHGSNPLASNARYWLGETFYVRADYQQAAQVFFEGYQSNTKGAKAPDMLLKLGMSLAQLGKRDEACATFDKVAADYAKSSGRIKTALSRERQRASCP